jgi:hypothetical protein
MPDSKLPKNRNNPKIKPDNFAKERALPRAQRGGKIQTQAKNIDWTPKKMARASLLLGGPYLMAILLTFLAGMQVIAYLLMAVALLIGLLVWFVRSWSSSDF